MGLCGAGMVQEAPLVPVLIPALSPSQSWAYLSPWNVCVVFTPQAASCTSTCHEPFSVGLVVVLQPSSILYFSCCFEVLVLWKEVALWAAVSW